MSVFSGTMTLPKPTWAVPPPAMAAVRMLLAFGVALLIFSAILLIDGKDPVETIHLMYNASFPEGVPH